ncbi:reverse transcriptase family protein, partial [Acinetobacter baumannii]
SGGPRGILPAHLKAIIRRKRGLRRLWATTRCPRIKRELNELEAELAAKISSYRGYAWEERIEEAREDPSSVSLHRLCRQLSNRPAPTCPLVDERGNRCFSAQARADVLAAMLERQFVPNDSAPSEAAFHQSVEESVASLLSSPVPPLGDGDLITPSELRLSIKRMKRRKAPGEDGIPSLAFFHFPETVVSFMTRLFNSILSTGHFPGIWKLGKVIALPKPGKDRRNPSSYRPITLLSHVGKLFERLLLRRVSPHILLRPEQFGFRSGHSTTLQLVRVMHHLADRSNARQYTAAVFLDIEKAFDRVWHAGLIYKLLQNTDLQHAYVRLLGSYLEGRSFLVAVEGAKSSVRPVTAGVPQGSVLAPFLYALYTNDIPTLEGNLQAWEVDVKLALFADDSAYFASSNFPSAAISRMQRLLDLLPQWLDRWRVAVNVGKTAALLYGPVRIRVVPKKLSLRGVNVVFRTTVRYLGCDIDRSLSMVAHVTESSVRLSDWW